MKILFVIYGALSFLLACIGVFNEETDEAGNFKPAWACMLGIIFLTISPIVAKLCGLQA